MDAYDRPREYLVLWQQQCAAHQKCQIHTTTTFFMYLNDQPRDHYIESATISVLTLSFVASSLLLLISWKILLSWKQHSRGCSCSTANVQKILQILGTGTEDFIGSNSYLTSVSWSTMPMQAHFLAVGGSDNTFQLWDAKQLVPFMY